MDFDRDKILSLAKEVLDLEGDAIKGLKPRLGDDFFKALEIVINTSGRVVVSGMGKSGILGKKLASTLASTGTPAFFIHPGEGAHGDLGMLVKGDVLWHSSRSRLSESCPRIPSFSL
ncbi:MAG: SIS domain-containing protein, partial [bacterium]|nr:SIS domain-containing protein [bacterium]